MSHFSYDFAPCAVFINAHTPGILSEKGSYADRVHAFRSQPVQRWDSGDWPNPGLLVAGVEP